MPKRASRPADHQLSFRAFLSHRYKSPEVNLHFFDIFSQVAEVQFEVDEGSTVMNVTRVERMIRNCDAFIGIYPFPGDSREATRDALSKASQYFRLELELAIRSRKPAIIFYDTLYGNLFSCPDSIMVRDFDAREILSKGGFPKAEVYRTAFRAFCDTVRAGMAYQVTRAGKPRQAIGLALPTGSPGSVYRKVDKAIQQTLNDELNDVDLNIISWPPVLDRKFFDQLHEIDWMVVDLGPDMAATGIPGYLHGRFVPAVRLKHSTKGKADIGTSPLERTLFGGVEVGYAEDMLVWENKRDLVKGLAQRVRAIKAQGKLISTTEEATNYFQAAARRKEAVFFSYSGVNRVDGAKLSEALNKRFQKVFDYRDGKSIRAGQPWLDEIFDQLSASALGISLLSPGYVESRNCIHEAQQMVAQLDSKKMKFVPVSIGNAEYKPPAFLSSIQSLTWLEPKSADDIVQQIIESLDA